MSHKTIDRLIEAYSSTVKRTALAASVVAVSGCTQFSAQNNNQAQARCAPRKVQKAESEHLSTIKLHTEGASHAKSVPQENRDTHPIQLHPHPCAGHPAHPCAGHPCAAHKDQMHSEMDAQHQRAFDESQAPNAGHAPMPGTIEVHPCAGNPCAAQVEPAQLSESMHP